MGRSVVALDTSVLVYFIEDHPRFADAAESTLDQVRKGRLSAVFSQLGMVEVLTGPKKRGRDDLVGQYRHFISTFPNLTLVGLDDEIVEVASDLRAAYGIRTPDAIHLATAITHEAAAFITNDRRLHKVKEINVELLSRST